jgi:ABC-2 type transport system ATP-binding protein
MPQTFAVNVENLSHRYGSHEALKDACFSVETGKIFGLLGPNGGGKTTLFRLLCTLLPIQTGKVSILGLDVLQKPDEVRKHVGITFQSPSLDDRLTIRENLKYQCYLYGIHGKQMHQRIDSLLEKLGLADRKNDYVKSLSGGLKRRVEIAKGMLHNPEVLLLDEPNTGLDPGARKDVWTYIKQLRDVQNMTVIVTTHLMDEAENCDQLGILDHGVLVANGTPDELRESIGGDCITIHSDDPDSLLVKIENAFQLTPQKLGSLLRIEKSSGHELVRDIVDQFSDDIRSIVLGKPTLEDVFISKTGHQFWEEIS